MSEVGLPDSSKAEASCPATWIGGYNVAIACSLPDGHEPPHRSPAGTTWEDPFGTWIKHCRTCDTRQVATSMARLLDISREHQGHYTTLEPSHVQ